MPVGFCKPENKKGVRPLAPLSFTKKGFFEGGTSGLTPFFSLFN
jgi:hypothetical protein